MFRVLSIQKEKKRAIQNKAKKFITKGGVLFYTCGGRSRHWISCKKQQQQIVQSCHADKLGGHLGRDKTREKVTSRYERLELVLFQPL